MNMLNRSLLCAALLFPTASCKGSDTTSAEGDATSKTAKPEAAKNQASASGSSAKAGGAFLKDAPVPWTSVLRATPEAVETTLGAHTREGGGRISCVRFLPKRVHFACTHIARDYAHPAFEKITVDYEDGRASAVSLVGFKQAKGDFSIDATLAAAGIKTARPPRPQAAEGAEVHVWFNHETQLLVGKDQFLMRLSTVDRDWAKTKLGGGSE